jgi:predicted nucleic acid-binding Zn finger protein
MGQRKETTMEILKIKRSTQGTGLKVYGAVQGDSGKTYNFAYFRRLNFRGWICSCESFFFDMFKKKKNCKHLRFVRQQVGRYAATVQN